MNLIKSERRYLNKTVTIPTDFLSPEIRNEIYREFGYMPHNAYVSNSAGNWIFISVVKDSQVYTITEDYYLDAELEDKEQTEQ